MVGTLWEWISHPFESYRYLVERYVIVPSAKHLPFLVASSLADVAGLIDCVIPSGAWRTTAAEVRASGAGGRWKPAVLFFERMTAPRRELVYLARMDAGRERLSEWRVVEHHRERVQALFDSGSSFVIADGHFASAAIAVAQKVLPVAAGFVAGDASIHANTPSELRRQLYDRSRDAGRLGLLSKVYPAHRLLIPVPDVWGPEPGWGHPRDRTGTVRSMLQRLKEPGGIVLVRIDAFWGAESGMERPFAGHAVRRFALGAATVARLAECPVVPFAAVIKGGRRCVQVHWGEPITPPPRREAQRDPATLDEAICFLEQAVGRYPGAYLADIGSARRWDKTARLWMSPAAAS